MDYFFHMGVNWCHLVPGFLLIPVLSFGYATELDALSDIASGVDQIIEQHLGDVSRFNTVIAGDNNYRGVVPSLERLEQYLYSLLVQSADQLDTNNLYLSRIENAILNATQKVEVVSSSLDPLLNSVSNINDSVVSILNAITNNAPLAYSPAFLTNWYATTLSTVYFDNSFQGSYLRGYYQRLFGHDPSSRELSDFALSYLYFGPNGGAFFDLISSLHPSVIPSDDEDLSEFYFERFPGWYRTFLQSYGMDGYIVGNQQGYLQKLGRINYYQYGTRELTDIVVSMTNYNILVDSPFVEVQTQTGKDHGFSNAFKDTVGDLAVSITPTVSDDLPEVNTNVITQIEDSDFSDIWRTASSSTPENNSLTPLATDIDGIIHQSSSSITQVFDQGNGSDYTFTVPNEFGGGSFTYTIPAMSPRYRPFLAFFVGLLKVVMVLYFGLMIWEDVFKVVWMGRRF